MLVLVHLVLPTSCVHRPLAAPARSPAIRSWRLRPARCVAEGGAADKEDSLGGMTMGDVLAAIAAKQQAAQPLEELVDETRGSLDAMLEFGSEELDEVMYELAADLRSVRLCFRT